MPDDVGCQIMENAYFLPVEDQQFPESLPGEAPAAGGHKQELAGAASQQFRPGPVQVLTYRPQSGFPHGCDPLLIAFSDSAQHAGFKP